MANICIFKINIEAVIPEAIDSLLAFSKLLESNITPLTIAKDHPDPELAGKVTDYAVQLDALLAGIRNPLPDEFIWVNSLPVVIIDGNRATIEGESKWGPPTTIIEVGSQRFPYLEFTVEGNTLGIGYERWIAIRGRLSQIEYMSSDDRSDEIFEWRILGDTVSQEEMADDVGWFHHLEQRALAIVGNG